MTPDIGHLSLFLDNSTIRNGLGENVRVADTVAAWSVDYLQFRGYLGYGMGFPDNYSLFVPDLWHITYGDAKCLPEKEAEELWYSTVWVRNHAKPFIESTEMVLKPHPGTRLYFKNIVPSSE
jgi:hypothetical protein